VNSILQILQQVVSDNLLPRTTEIVRRSAICMALAAVIGVLSFIALFFLALAFYSWMALHLLPPLAALATAGASLLIALVAALIAYLVMKPKPKPVPGPVHQPGDPSTLVASAAAATADELCRSVDNNPKTTLLLAGIAGFAAATFLKK